MPLLRAIDKGLANSRIGIVLVTPALLRRLPTEGIADKELSALTMFVTFGAAIVLRPLTASIS